MASFTPGLIDNSGTFMEKEVPGTAVGFFWVFFYCKNCVFFALCQSGEGEARNRDRNR